MHHQIGAKAVYAFWRNIVPKEVVSQCKSAKDGTIRVEICTHIFEHLQL